MDNAIANIDLLGINVTGEHEREEREIATNLRKELLQEIKRIDNLAAEADPNEERDLADEVLTSKFTRILKLTLVAIHDKYPHLSQEEIKDSIYSQVEAEFDFHTRELVETRLEKELDLYVDLKEAERGSLSGVKARGVQLYTGHPVQQPALPGVPNYLDEEIPIEHENLPGEVGSTTLRDEIDRVQRKGGFHSDFVVVIQDAVTYLSQKYPETAKMHPRTIPARVMKGIYNEYGAEMYQRVADYLWKVKEFREGITRANEELRIDSNALPEGEKKRGLFGIRFK